MAEHIARLEAAHDFVVYDAVSEPFYLWLGLL